MTQTKSVLFSTAAVVVATMALVTATTIKAHAQDSAVTITAADPNLQGDGTLSPAAAQAIARGTLRLPADEAQKADANRAHDAAVQSGALRAPTAAELAATGAAARSLAAPAVVGGHNFAGQSSVNSSPTDSTGTIGPTRYIQLINSIARIYNRTTNAAIGSGTLNQLANNASSVNSFDPQIIWDPSTNRFYYTMDSVFSSSNHKLAFGFSKTASPNNVTTDWCHYYVSYGTPFPDYPKLGDSFYFLIIGVNVFNPSFVGSDIVAVSKPAAGTTCPAASTFKSGKKANLKNTSNQQVFTPVPSNQVDNNATGYVVTRNISLPSNKLWFFNVTKSGTGSPLFGSARGVTVASYTSPADATQPTFTQKLDTLDARNTQAVQAINPDRGSVQSFWTQHTIANGSVGMVRWYEINPAPATPVVLRSGNIASSNCFLYNAGISPDRKKNGASVAFGDSFVVEYSVSGSSCNISPRIVAGSSFNGGALAFLLVRNAVGPYRDFTCASSGSTCRWGDYSAATPDPAPTTSGRGEVWGTNAYSGVVNPSTANANGRTQIFALQP